VGLCKSSEVGSTPTPASILLKLDYIYPHMNRSEIVSLIRECVQEVVFEHVLMEKLLLKRGKSRKYGEVLLAVSDETDQKKARQETFRNKGDLYRLGFRWDGDLNSWVIPQNQLRQAQIAMANINKEPIEKFIEKVEEIPDFIRGAENLSRKDELIQKIDGFVEELSTAVDDAAKSDMIRNFLAFNARFYKYSFYNTLLIFLQNKNATKVAGFKQWEEKFHRRVKKGAKGITILAPIKPKKAGEEPAPEDEDEKEKDVKRQFIRFIAVTVFDVADTEAIDARGEIPDSPTWHASDEPNDVADKVFEYAKEMAEDMGIKVTQDTAHGGEMGYSAGGHLNLTSDIAGVNRAATMVHEIAHELLHHRKSSPFYIGDEESGLMTKESKELQAESTSFIVMKYYGLPVEHQANYLALWRANKDSVKQNLSVIKRAADFIITELDKIQAAHAKTEPPKV